MYDRPRPYRFWPWSKPVKTVTSFQIFSTPNVFVEIDPDEMFINNSGGYIEISSLKLTQFGVFGAGVLQTLIGMYAPVAQCTYTYGWNFPVVGEYLEPTDAWTYRAQNQWWDDTPVEVFINGTIQPSNGSVYEVDRDEGVVIFVDARPLMTSSPRRTPTRCLHRSHKRPASWPRRLGRGQPA